MKAGSIVFCFMAISTIDNVLILATFITIKDTFLLGCHLCRNYFCSKAPLTPCDMWQMSGIIPP